MKIEFLKKNLAEARRIVKYIDRLKKSEKTVSEKEKSFYSQTIQSLYSKLKILNDSIPDILMDISGVKKLDSISQSNIPSQGKSDLSVLSYKSPSTQTSSMVALKKEDKEKFIKELSISEENLKKMPSTRKENEGVLPSSYVAISNRFFGRFSERVSTGRFNDLKEDLRQSNSRFLLASYLAVAIFSSLIIFVVALVILAIMIVIYPIAWLFFWVPILLAILSLVIFYLAPSLEKSSVSKSINTEIPFATIYMAAISHSGIEPTKIFKIIAQSKEYPKVGYEIRKVINQVEIYGYDLVNALKSVSRSTPNQKLAELLNGMASNIVSGGSLKNFLEKKSENLLNDYRLEREKYNDVAATFMDIYISILITAPLILVMLIVVMGITGLGLGGLTVDTLVIFSIGAVVLVNIIFLMFLQMRQPKV